MIKCLGSGSKGNGWVLDFDEEVLILDCGIPVKDALIGIGFEIERVAGCAVTHFHGDHAKFISQYEGRGLTVFKPYENRDEPFQTAIIGRYKIKTFPLEHGVPCFGFLITAPTGERILYATDTEYIRYRFKDIDHFIVEANYSNDLLDDELNDTVKRDHVLRGHMELSTTLRFLKENVSDKTQSIVLAHLSNDNANADMFLAKTQREFLCTVFIAKKNLQIASYEPFRGSKKDGGTVDQQEHKNRSQRL